MIHAEDAAQHTLKWSASSTMVNVGVKRSPQESIVEHPSCPASTCSKSSIAVISFKIVRGSLQNPELDLSFLLTTTGFPTLLHYFGGIDMQIQSYYIEFTVCTVS